MCADTRLCLTWATTGTARGTRGTGRYALEFDTIIDAIYGSVPRAQNALAEFAQPWRLYQLGILALAFLIAHVVSRLIEPRLEARIRAMESVPRPRMRLFVTILRRLRPIIFVALSWIAVFALRATTWPSRSYLVALVASLVLAWVLVGVSGRLIRNRALRTVVTWGAWTFATLAILGQLGTAADALDAAALSFGEVRISLLVVLKGAITVALLFAGAGLLANAAHRRIVGIEDITPASKVLADKGIRLFLYGAAVVVGLQSVGFDLTSLTVLSGAIGLGIGFGLQKVVSNLISGVILLLDKSIKPGDVISLGETFGWISELGARYVAVVTRDGREYLIPNEDLITGQVVNWSHSSDLVRLDLFFGVAYASDPHKVRRLAREAAAKVRRVVPEPAPVCHITGFGDSSIDFVLRFWIRDPVGGITNVRGDVFLALWDALKAEGVEIPFPRRDVTILGGPQPAGPHAAEG
ncbi:mechanosensitive ion channel [Limibaculum sp. FT325]|uniref:mechanosensitive ion channel family protein n=1 Tax=Thermohalobaculum sediminis TaxID=2939436 RepID=UPI0020C109F9|nr:mechanosensitive ion channel domain-containing protein [Limibaculum sediminis]MCL5777038.1 mechanosensitive ion channel [Limibaculum sediminis]